MARDGVGADGGVAGLDMALGHPAPAYNAIARTPAFGGLMMIEWARCLPGPYGPGYKLARSSGPRASRADLDSESQHCPAPSPHIRPRIVVPTSKRRRPALIRLRSARGPEDRAKLRARPARAGLAF